MVEFTKATDPDFKERTRQHWEFIKGVLETACENPEVIDKIGFHYRTAMIHGYKHARQEYEL